jgi:hypothetical protein
MSDQDPGINFCKLREDFRRERRHGDTHKAYAVIQGMIGSPEAELRDFFAAGECAIRLHLFPDAVEHLSKTISLCEESGDNYFLDQSYFWRAYALIKMNMLTQAASDLNLIKHVESPFYVYSVVPEKAVIEYSVKELLDAIEAG